MNTNVLCAAKELIYACVSGSRVVCAREQGRNTTVVKKIS